MTKPNEKPASASTAGAWSKIVQSVTAIWIDDRATRWASFIEYVNLVRTSWPFIAGVVFMTAISLQTQQGIEALNYSVNTQSPGGVSRAIATGVGLFLFVIGVHEAVLRNINVYYHFSPRAAPFLRPRFLFASALALIYPLVLLAFYLNALVAPPPLEEQRLKFALPGLIADWAGWVALGLFLFGALYDFSAPAWRRQATPSLKQAERLYSRVLPLTAIAAILIYGWNQIAAPMAEAAVHWNTIDWSQSAGAGVIASGSALVLGAFWIFRITETSLSIRRFYSNSHQFIVFHRLRNLISVSLLAAFLVVVLALALFPVLVASRLGPVATLATCVSAVCGLLAIFAWLSARRQSLPLIMVLLLLALISPGVSRSSFHDVAVIEPVALSGEVRLVQDHVADWAGKRRPTDPAIVVIAEGGGIRAALHTASLLACLDQRRPGFSDDIFIMSGVSGGSVGLAAYLSARADKVPLGEANRTDCGFPVPGAPLALSEPGNYTMPYLVSAYLQSDFFSPVMAGYFLRDLPLDATACALLSCPAGLRDRARVFEASFRNAYREHLIEMRSLSPADARPIRARPPEDFPGTVEKAFEGAPAQPIVLFNTFDIGAGQPAMVSNARFARKNERFWNLLDSLPAGSTLDINAASHLSARFPLISPPGRICPPVMNARTCDRQGAGPFVDGGYFDNSGAAAAEQAVRLLLAHDGKAAAPVTRPIIVIHVLVRTKDKEKEPARLPGFFELSSPLAAVMRARAVHGAVPVRRLCETLSVGSHSAGADCDGLLGWLETTDAGQVACRLGVGLSCSAEGAAETAPEPMGGERVWIRSTLGLDIDCRQKPQKSTCEKLKARQLPLGWLLGEAGSAILWRVDDHAGAILEAIEAVDNLAVDAAPPA